MDYQQALADGYTPEEVMGELARRGVKMNYQQAIADGHSPDEVLAEMNSRDKTPAAKPMTVKDVGRSPEYRAAVKKFIQTEAAAPSVKRTMVESVPVIGQALADKTMGLAPNPVRPEHYMEQVLGPEETSKSNLGAIAKGLTRVYRDPEGMVYDAAVRGVRGLGQMAGEVADVPENVKRLGAVYQGLNPWSEQKLAPALAETPYAKIVGGIVKGTASPLGLAGGENFREAWQQTPLESIATVAGTTAPLIKNASGIAGSVKALPGKLRQLELDVRSGTIGANHLEPRVAPAKLSSLEAKYAKMPERYNTQRADTLWEQMSRGGDERLLSTEGRVKLAEQGRLVPNVLKNLEAENKIPKVSGDLIGQMQATDAALKAIGEGELGALRAEVQRVAPQMPPEMQLQHRRFWESRSNAYRNQGDTALANAAQVEADFYSQPRTFDEFYQRSQRAGDAVNWLKEEQTPLKADMKRDRAMLRDNMDTHAQQVLPDNPSLHKVSKDYAALAEYQERLSDIFMDEVLAKLDGNAQAGLNRLAAAQAAAGVAMGKAKLLGLAAETVGYNKFQKMLASPNRKVMHYWSAGKALPTTPRAGYQAPVGPNVPNPTTDVLSGGKVPYGASQGIQGVNTGGIVQPEPGPAMINEPTVGAQIPAQQSSVPVARDMRQPAPPEPTVYDPSTGAQIPARQGRAVVPRDMRQPAPPAPTAYDPSTGRQIPASQGGTVVPRDMRQPAPPEPTVYDPSTGKQIPAKQSTKPFEKMTFAEKKEAVSVLAESYGISKAEAARIVRQKGKNLSDYGL